jgi:hypothetical protein
MLVAVCRTAIIQKIYSQNRPAQTLCDGSKMAEFGLHAANVEFVTQNEE